MPLKDSSAGQPDSRGAFRLDLFEGRAAEDGDRFWRHRRHGLGPRSRPLAARHLALAREQEAHPRRRRAVRMKTGHGDNGGVLPIYSGMLVVIAAVIGLGLRILP